MLSGGEQQRQRDDRQRRQSRPAAGASNRRGCREAEKANLGGGVEAQAEQHPDRVHLPGGVDELVVTALEDPVHEAAVGQQYIEFFLLVAAGLRLPPHLDDANQHHQVEGGDEVQEAGRDHGADDPAGAREALLEPACRLGRERDPDRQREDDAGVPEREEEADPERAFALLQQVPGGVVDGADVIGVEGMPQPEAIGEGGRAGEYQVPLAVAEQVILRLRVVVVEQPEPGKVQRRHKPEQTRKPRDLVPAETHLRRVADDVAGWRGDRAACRHAVLPHLSSGHPLGRYGGRGITASLWQQGLPGSGLRR